MSDIDWRVWLKVKLDNGTTATLVPAKRIYGAGRFEDDPGERPFIVIRCGPESRGPFPGATVRTATIWVHDDPGSYMTIDSILAAIKSDLEGAVTEAGGVAARWTGDSTELADEGFKTITRNTSYQLNGKEQANA